jgi:hypothetical protein
VDKNQRCLAAEGSAMAVTKAIVLEKADEAPPLANRAVRNLSEPSPVSTPLALLLLKSFEG